MTTMTPTEAADTLCPWARTFIMPGATDLHMRFCKGPECMLWRWSPIMADHPAFVAAIKKEIAGGITHKAAVSKIMADRAAYGIPTKPERGFCGGGGQP